MRDTLGALKAGDWANLLNRMNVPVSVREPMMSALRDWLGGGVLPPEQRPLLAKVPELLTPERKTELLARLYVQQLRGGREQLQLRFSGQVALRELATAQQTLTRGAMPPVQAPESLFEAVRWLSSNDADAAEALLLAVRERVIAEGNRKAEKAQAVLEKLAANPPQKAVRFRFDLPVSLVEVVYTPPRTLFGWLALAVVMLVVLSLWL